MIGIEALISYSGPILGLVMGLVFLLAFRDKRRLVGLILMILPLWFLYRMYPVLSEHFAFHKKITSLASTEINSITVADKEFTQPEQIQKMTDAFKSSVWFEPQHGRWDAPVPLNIKFRNGEEFRGSLARYTRKDGVLIINGTESYSVKDFNAALPSVLQTMGADLKAH